MKRFTIGLKKTAWLLLLAATILPVVFVLYPALAFAQEPLVPCNGVNCTVCDLYEGVRRIINFLLWYIALPLTVAAVAGSGILFLLSGGSETRRTLAKSALSYAAIGMLLAFGAWVIVNTILTTLGYKGNWTDYGICKQFGELVAASPRPASAPPAPPPPAPPPGTPPEGTFKTEEEARNFFAGAGIGVKGRCAPGQTQDCVNLAGLPKTAAEGLIKLKNDCGCAFRISGGTEGGHLRHGVGKPVVDLVPLTDTPTSRRNLRDQAIKSGAAGGAYCEAQGGARDATCGPGTNHVHVIFPY